MPSKMAGRGDGRHFKNYLQTMPLKLTEYVRIIISLLYKPKKQSNSDIYNFFSKIFNFRLYFTENGLF